MTTVYVVEDCFPYEGCRLRFIAETEEQARDWAQQQDDITDLYITPYRVGVAVGEQVVAGIRVWRSDV